MPQHLPSTVPCSDFRAVELKLPPLALLDATCSANGRKLMVAGGCVTGGMPVALRWLICVIEVCRRDCFVAPRFQRLLDGDAAADGGYGSGGICVTD